MQLRSYFWRPDHDVMADVIMLGSKGILSGLMSLIAQTSADHPGKSKRRRDLKGKHMKFKILVTGKNIDIVRDVSEHLEKDKGYETVKCKMSKADLFDITLALEGLPKAIIICLGNETESSVRMYDILADAISRDGCSTIVITNDEDEKIFMQYTGLRKVFFLSRPISLNTLYDKLSSIEAEAARQREQSLMSLREYVNEDAGKTDRRKKQILVVDDDSEQLMHIRDQLEEFYEVALVKSGETAFRYLESHMPDLILLDYMMPELDGPGVLRNLRMVDEYAHIPVIFLTGINEKSIVLQTLMDLKPQGYIIKPVKKSDLVAKIIDVLE